MLRISNFRFTPTYDYLLILNDRGAIYDIKIEKNTIRVKIVDGVVCTAGPCNKNYTVDFDSKNMDKIYDLFEELFPKNKKKMAISIQSKRLTRDQVKILIAIIRNDKEYIDTNKIELEQDPDIKLAYKLVSSRIDCSGAILKLYDDNTYKYFYSMTASPRAGNYEFDTKKLIDNLYRYNYTNEDDKTIEEIIRRGPFYLEDSTGTQYTIYDDNRELKELLQELDLNLDVCMQQ